MYEGAVATADAPVTSQRIEIFVRFSRDADKTDEAGEDASPSVATVCVSESWELRSAEAVILT